MPSSFGQFFRRNSGASPASPGSNEDLECGHALSLLQTPTASGYQSSPSRVYLPATQRIHASTAPQTPPSHEYPSHIQYNGQHGSAVQMPLTPSGPSRVVGYLPRSIYSGPSPFVGSTRLIMPSQPSQNASNGDSAISNSLPQRRSTSTSSTTSQGTPSPRSPFDAGKHGQALRRLETHGSLKTVPTCQQDGDALNRTSVSTSGMGWVAFEEDHAAGLRGSVAQQSGSRTSAHQYETEVSPANDTIRGIVRNIAIRGSERSEDTSTHDEVEGEEDGQRSIGKPIPTCVHPAHNLVRSPTFEEIDEYLWSPAPSDDGQEAPSESHAPSDALQASLISGLASDSHDSFSRSSHSHGNEHIYSYSGASGNPRVMDSPLPHIDVLIPAGNIDLDSHPDFLSSSQHVSSMGSRDSSSILLRYTGIITDGASSRPMSEIELKDEVSHSLGDRAKTGWSMLSSGDSNSQADHRTGNEQICREYEPNALPETSPLDQVQDPSAEAGPGSSQTSSSLSTNRYASDPSSHTEPPGNRGFVSSRTRCGTPPLLFGKNAISKPENSPRLAVGSTSRCFDQNAKAVRQKETDRLPRASYSLGERDWETVSGETEAERRAFGGIALDIQTGSSLADTSDSGNLSSPNGTPYPACFVKARPILQHPAHPRHNHSFMLLKNSQTGDLVQVPQYEYSSGGRLPNNNARGQSVSRVRADSTYQHPPPLPVEHNHPFSSSPPIIRFTNPSAMSMVDSCVVMQQNHLDSKSSNSGSSGLSEGVQEVNRKPSQNPLYSTSQDVSCVIASKEQSYQSSAWLSTVSEVASSEPSLPGNGGTFTKMLVRDGKGHLNETPKQGSSQEVGSSLADASSSGANFSSSPMPLTSSPIQFSDTPPSMGRGFRKQTVRHDLEYGSQNLLGDFHKSLGRPFNREDSASSTTNTEDRSRSHSASGPRMENRNASPRRRRSSSESHSRLMNSPSAHKASALNLSSSDDHIQQTTGSGLLLRNPFLHSDDNDSRHMSYQRDITERRGRQPRTDEASIDSATTPSSIESRSFVRNGVLHTALPPPILDHPVYGRDCPWDRIRLDHPPPRPLPDSLGRPLFQRPVARAESPHLHRIPHPPTAELLERHVLLSRMYLILSMVIPPIALVYGHGYLDGIMRFHTEGEMHGFCNTEKTIALCWGYGLSVLCIVAIVIGMIIISASG